MGWKINAAADFECHTPCCAAPPTSAQAPLFMTMQIKIEHKPEKKLAYSQTNK